MSEKYLFPLQIEIKSRDMKRKYFYVLFVFFLLFCYSTTFADEGNDRNYWVDRYLSVCYPLKKMTVTSNYGSRRDPFTGKKTFHSGMDLKANKEEVYCMFDGVVQKIGSDNRSGLYVILRHGEYTVSYCHLSQVKCSVDDRLFAGDLVGISGNTGRSTGPHLHITCKYKGESRNPVVLINYIKEVRKEAVVALGGNVDRENASRMSENDFLNRYAGVAMTQQQRYGIPASVILAQMAYESGWGNSALARSGNNFFGIKATREWLAEGRPYSRHNDDKPNEAFCNYDSPEESIEHHSRLLMSKRYSRCRRYESTDYHNWLVAIKAAGYATAPDYVRKLEGIIKRHKLYLYDRQALRA